MSPKVKGYTDIYAILTYTGTETHVSFGLFITRNHRRKLQGARGHVPPNNFIEGAMPHQ